LFFAMGHDYTYSGINELTILLYTKRPNNIPASDMDVVDDMTQGDTIARGVFTIFCKEHSCYPSPYNTAIFLNAKDPAKLKLNPDIESSEKYIEE